VITGHLGVAGAAGSASRERISSVLFVALLLASLTPDIVDALYWAVGFCSPYGLYSHTVHAVVLEAAIVGGIAFLATGSRSVALIFAIVVLMHAPADFFTGRKLVIPGGEMFGLRWYDWPLRDWLLEVPTAVTGWWILRRSGRAPRWATSVWAVAVAVLLQTTFDVLARPGGSGLKPNACPVVPPPLSP
jgi:hypothetical protein